MNQNELFEITHRVLSDNLPDKINFVYIHSTTRDNQKSSLDAGAKLYREGFVNKIGITWADASVYEEWISEFEKAMPNLARIFKEKNWPAEDGSIAGYLGHINWSEELVNLGVDRSDIVLIRPSFKHYFSTAGESVGLVKYCKKNGIKSLSVIGGSPLHQVRSIISGISALIYADATNINLYSSPGRLLDWNEEVVHSQGEIKGSRVELLGGELRRISKYQTEGDFLLRPIGEILEYLNQRD